MSQNKNIVGKWSKIKISSCNEKYPEILEFMKNGIYYGSKGENKNEYTLWDAGNYEIFSDNQIRISTANDKIIVYNFSNRDNILSFEDEENCQIQYQRIQ